MRLKTLLIILLASPVLTGCLKEHPGDCGVPENLEILFTYSAFPDRAFTEKITSVDLFLFDAQTRFITRGRASLAELSTYAGMRFTVDPGIYYAVAWGNVREHSQFSDFTPDATMFDDCFVEIVPSANDTGDPVFYAPREATSRLRSGGEMTYFEVIVPKGEKTVKTLDFVRAHRTINVWIKGYYFETMAGVKEYPTVQITQRWSKYDFFFTPSIRRDYTQQTHLETISGESYDKAAFHSALGAIDNAIDVIVSRTSDGLHLYTVDLDRFILDNNIIDTDEIDILIIFNTDMGITVTVPSWTATQVNPGV